MARIVANALIFQIGWVLCVWYGTKAAIAVGVVAAAIYFFLFLRSREELMLITSIVVAGIIGDSLLGLVGLFDFGSVGPLLPLWMIVIWMLFATTIPWALRWLVEKPRWFLGLCGISGPLSYLVGVSQSVAEFGITVPPRWLFWFLSGWGTVCLFRNSTNTGNTDFDRAYVVC